MKNRLVFLGDDDARETNNTDLGEMDFVKIQTTVIEQTKKSGYIKWTGEDRFTIGKFAAENGTAAAVRYFKSKFPKIKESSVRGFKEKYEKQLKQATQNKEQLTTKIIPKYELKTGRPLLLGKFDEMVQTYIHGLSSRGAVITWAVANAAAKALMKKYPGVIGEIDVDSSYWAQSLFRRMGFTKRRKTSTKVSLFTVAFRSSVRSSVCSAIISKTIHWFFLNVCLKLYTLKCFKHTKGIFFSYN